MSVDDILSYKATADEDLYAILGCDESATVSKTVLMSQYCVFIRFQYWFLAKNLILSDNHSVVQLFLVTIDSPRRYLYEFRNWILLPYFTFMSDHMKILIVSFKLLALLIPSRFFITSVFDTVLLVSFASIPETRTLPFFFCPNFFTSGWLKISCTPIDSEQILDI